MSPFDDGNDVVREPAAIVPGSRIANATTGQLTDRPAKPVPRSDLACASCRKDDSPKVPRLPNARIHHLTPLTPTTRNMSNKILLCFLPTLSPASGWPIFQLNFFTMPSPGLCTVAALTLCIGGFAPLPAAEPAQAPSNRVTPEYTVTDLGPRLHIAALNARGDVVGTLNREPQNSVAFLYSQGQLRELGTLGGPFSSAQDINDAGHIVGYASTPKLESERVFERHGFLYADGVMRSLGTLGGIPDYPGFFEAHAINNAGQIAGQSRRMKAWLYADGERLPLGTLVPAGAETTLGEAFFNADGTSTPLITRSEGYVVPKRINSTGAVVGSARTPDSKQHAFLYLPATGIRDLGTVGGDYSGANGINDAGLIVGSSKIDALKSHAFLYRDGRMHDLGVPGSYESSTASGINRSGTIVGTASSVTGGGFLWIGIDSRAYRYTDGQWIDLNTLVDLTGTGLKRLDSAEAINDSGQIIGRASGSKTYHGYLLTPIPKK